MRLIYRIKQLMLMGGDFLAFILGFWLSLAIRNWQIPNWPQIERHLVLFFFLFLIWLIINIINGLYDLGNLKNKKSQRYFLEASLISFLTSIVFFYLLSSTMIAPKTILLLNIILGYGLSALWRITYNKYINSGRLSTNIIIIGFTPEVEELINILQNKPEISYQICALIDPNKKIKPEKFPFFDVYHGLNTIRQPLVIIMPKWSLSRHTSTKIARLYRNCITFYFGMSKSMIFFPFMK